MPRSRRAWVSTGSIIVLMLVVLVEGIWLGGGWVYAFPAYLLFVLALMLVHRWRLGRERNSSRSG